MLNGLALGLRNLKAHKEVAVIGLLIGWGLFKFTEMLIESIGPNSFAPSFRKEFTMEVQAAEGRSKEYADIRYFDLKESIDRIDRNVETINKNIMKIHEEKRR